MSSENAEIKKLSGWTNILRSLVKKHEHLLKYLIIGGTASALDVIIFLFLYNKIETTALFAHSISVPTAVLFSFFVNVHHNFKTNDYLVLRMISFIIVCIIGYVVGYFVIMVTVSSGLSANIGKIFSLPVVFVIQYVLNSRITFRKVVNE